MRRPIASGFSLLELVVILTILGLVAAVAVPALPDRRSEPLDHVVETLVTLLRTTRMTALEKATPTVLTIDPRGGRYQIAAETNDSTAIVVDGAIIIPAGTRIGPDSIPRRFRFSPNGAAVGDSVVLTGDGGWAVLTVDPWTGAIHVHR